MLKLLLKSSLCFGAVRDHLVNIDHAIRVGLEGFRSLNCRIWLNSLLLLDSLFEFQLSLVLLVLDIHDLLDIDEDRSRLMEEAILSLLMIVLLLELA